MIIKKIILKNFRQYIDAEITFSTDKQKNVTIISGNNGTGKTTLAQAFQWVLYGETEFKDQEVINRMVKNNIKYGRPANVSVTLEIEFNGSDYTLKRQSTYKISERGKVDLDSGKFVISYLDEKGQQIFKPDYQKDVFIKRIMPKDLSRFFFFDGERIDEMSKEIIAGKSKEFKEAVYSLVGLRATLNAIGHLKSESYQKKTVIRIFDQERAKSSKSAEKVKEYDKKIEELQTELNNIKKEKEEKELSLEKCTQELKDNKRILLSESKKMEIKEAYIKVENKIDRLEKKKNDAIANDVLVDLGTGIYGFCITKIKEKVVPYLTEDTNNDRTIDGLTSKTVHALLKRKKCICGACLEEDKEAYHVVKELLDYVYPKTIHSVLSDYKKDMKMMERYNSDFYNRFHRNFVQLSEIKAGIEAAETERDELMEQLSDTQKGESARTKIQMLESEKDKLLHFLGKVDERLEQKQSEIDRKITEKDNLLIVNEDSIKYTRYYEYAKAIYEKLYSGYQKDEKKYNALLQERMNEIFEKIYEGNIFIEVDDKYRLRVLNAEKEELELNTAQSYAVVFAFISAIIDLSKEKANDDLLYEDKIDEEKEGYPLIMDAPLSAFDKTRIRSICNEIPQIANQVIMFIKDTDGDIAREHLRNRIGKLYIAEKVEGNSMHTEIKEA